MKGVRNNTFSGKEEDFTDKFSAFREEFHRYRMLHRKRLESELSELSGQLKPVTIPNVFRVLGLRRDERSATRMLHWLLSPNEDHGGGHAFAQRILPLLSDEQWDYDDLEVVRFSRVSGEMEDGEIDLILTSGGNCLGVEIKTTHREDRDKLERELRLLQYKYGDDCDMVYITPYMEALEGFRTVKWYDILLQIRRVLTEVSLEPPQEMIVEQFIENTEVNIVSEFRKLSEEALLYLRHMNEIELAKKAFEKERKDFFLGVVRRFERHNLEGVYLTNPSEARLSGHSRVQFYKKKWQSRKPHVHYEINEGFGNKDLDGNLVPTIEVNLDIEEKGKAKMRMDLHRRARKKIERLEKKGFSIRNEKWHYIGKEIPYVEGKDLVGDVMEALETLMNLDKDIDAVIGQ